MQLIDCIEGEAVLMFTWSGQPDLVRALQKDDYYVDSVRDELQEVVSLIGGARHAANLHHEVDLIAALAYYTVQMRTMKTLGEEYCDLERVTPDWVVPRPSRTAALVFLQVICPYLVAKSRRPAPSPSTHPIARLYNQALKLVQRLPSMNNVRRLNLALFYLFGRYLRLSTRLLRIRYLYTRAAPSSRHGYGILGVLILIQMSIQALIHTHDQFFVGKAVVSGDLNDEEDVAVMSMAGGTSVARNCTLCLSPREAPTVTDCGHVYCWQCIANWCTNKAECPLCRQPVLLSNLVRLSHYN